MTAYTSTCLADNCEKRAEVRGLCKRHYDSMSYLVRKGGRSWEELEQIGRALPPITQQANEEPQVDIAEETLPHEWQLLDAAIDEAQKDAPVDEAEIKQQWRAEPHRVANNREQLEVEIRKVRRLFDLAEAEEDVGVMQYLIFQLGVLSYHAVLKSTAYPQQQ
jgi:hypothetical protein